MTAAFVIPEKAGIHGLNVNFFLSHLTKYEGSAIDFRLRGNDNCCNSRESA